MSMSAALPHIAAPASPARAQADSVRVETLTTSAEITGLSAPWRALGSRPFVPAGSHLQAWLAPALKHCSAKLPAQLLALWRGDRLCGVFALKAGGGLIRRSWSSPLTFCGTPLIDQEAPEEILQAFLRAAQGKAIQLTGVAASGPFWDMLAQAIAETGGTYEILDRWERAALKPKGTFDEWFSGNFDRKRRKEYRRLRARLAEGGTLESVSWAKGDPVGPWIDDLIALEARGWKGRRGTALAADAVMATAFREALGLLAAEGSLRFWKIVFDGKPIAAMSGLVSGSQGWLGKIAYDEAFAKHSPGVQLILDATETLIGRERLALVDSCAIPNHPMINNIWRDRIAFCDVMIKGPELSPVAFRLAVAAEKGRRQARAMAKTLFYRAARRQES